MSDNLKKINALLIGTSQMAQDYISVLDYLGINFVIVGRGFENAKICEENTGYKPFLGGVSSFLKNNSNYYSHAIVAVGVDQLFDVTSRLIEFGVENILIEKPGALNLNHLEVLNKMANKNSKVFIAYNRRFFSSTIKAREIIENDNGVLSFNFEFTEWSHIIENLDKPRIVKEKWFLANSTHVVDLAFNIGGMPIEMSSYTKGALNWHKSSSIFSGAGITEKKAVFSYNANWVSSGRWGIEILTPENKLILRPMEKLQIQKRGTIKVEEVEIDDYYDIKFKPGLYRQLKAFISDNNSDNLCQLHEQIKLFPYYNRIANY